MDFHNTWQTEVLYFHFVLKSWETAESTASELWFQLATLQKSKIFKVLPNEGIRICEVFMRSVRELSKIIQQYLSTFCNNKFIVTVIRKQDLSCQIEIPKLLISHFSYSCRHWNGKAAPLKGKQSQLSQTLIFQLHYIGSFRLLNASGIYRTC